MRFVPRCTPRFLAREVDLDRFLQLVREGASLITVTGPAGVGKSTLLSHALLDVGEDVDRLVLSCALGSAKTAPDFLRAVWSQLVPADSAPVVEDGLLDALDARPTMLVLDDFEHLVPAAVPQVQRWVRECSELQIVVTSRRRLGLTEERLVDLAPLEVPSSDEDRRAGPAMALFLRCLADLDPRLAERATADPMTPALVRALGGLPLAIELAAAKCRTFSPTALHDRMADLLNLLSAGAAGSTTSVRNCLDASWRNLSEEARRTLAQISLFQGPFSLDDAMAVVDLSHPEAVLPALESLRDGSFIQVDDGGALRLLLLVRQFASDALGPSDAEAARTRHLRWAARLAADAERRLHQRDASSAFAELERAEADLLTALAFGVQRESPAERSDALAIAMTLSVRADLAGSVGVPSELEELLTTDPVMRAAHPARCAEVKIRRGFARLRRGRLEEARDELVAARAMLAKGDDAIDPVMATVLDAEIRLAERNEVEAIAMLEASAERWRAAGDGWAEARTREALIDAHRQVGRPELGLRQGELALALLGPDDHLLHAPVLTGLAFAALEMGLTEQARAYVRRGMEVLDRASVRRPRTEGGLELARARALHLGRETRAAIEGYERARGIALSGGDTELAAYAELSLGLALVEHQRGVEACEWFHRAEARLDPWRPYALIGAMISTAVEAGLGLLESARARQATWMDALARAPAGPFAAIGRGCAEVVRILGARSSDVARFALRLPLGEGASPETPALLTELDGQIGGLLIEARVTAALIRSAETSTSASPEPPGREMAVATDGAWFRCPDGKLVSCGRRPVMRRVVVALARLRAEAPGASLSPDDVIREGWPGEKMLEASARRRLQVMVSRLREMGLREVLETTDLGYRIDPTCRVHFRG